MLCFCFLEKLEEGYHKTEGAARQLGGKGRAERVERGVSRIEYEGKYVGKLSPYTYIIQSLYYLHALQGKVGMH
jgi:hypothetical protein